jgi:hypothetical protein
MGFEFERLRSDFSNYRIRAANVRKKNQELSCGALAEEIVDELSPDVNHTRDDKLDQPERVKP